MNDRSIGYLALAAVVTLLTTTGWFVVRALREPSQQRVVVIPQVGSLKLADPVVRYGTEIGAVRAMRLAGDGRSACLTLDFSPPVTIHRGYRILVVDLGIMGDRMLTLDVGDTTAPIVPVTDTLRGEFVLGPSEALALVGRLEKVVHSWAEFTTRLACGDSTHQPLVNHYAKLVWVTDSLSEALVGMLGALDGAFGDQLDSLTHLITTASDLSSRAAQELPPLLQSLSAQVEALAATVSALDSTLGQAQDLVTAIQSPEAQEALDTIGQIRDKLNTLMDALDTLRRRGLRLKVWPF